MQTMQDTLRDWNADVREDLTERTETATKTLRNIARSAPYAALGVTVKSLEKTRDAIVGTIQLPMNTLKAASRLPEKATETFEKRAARGRRIVSRVTGRDAFGEAADGLDRVGSQTKATATTLRHAAEKTADAVEEAAEATFNPQDTRAYEERTYGELRTLATERDIEGRSSMNKAKLIAALRHGR